MLATARRSGESRAGRWIQSSDGHAAVWRPGVARIPDVYLDCVVYLYGSEADAEDGLRTGGSGFLVGVRADDLKVALIYAVTNRHVVEPGNLVIRLRTKDGKHSII